MPPISPECSDTVLSTFREQVKETLDTDIPFEYGTHRLSLTSYVRDRGGSAGVRSIGSGLIIYDPEKEYDFIEDLRSRSFLNTDEIAIRRFFLDFHDPFMVESSRRSLPAGKGIPPILLSSGVLTRPAFEGNGLGSLLFKVSDVFVPALLRAYAADIQDQEVIARIVDNSVNRWTTRRAQERDYQYVGQDGDKAVWEKVLRIS